MSLPEVLYKKVDDYVDSLAPQIQPRIASELETFQQKTIDSLESQVVDAFRSLFNSNKQGSQDGSRGPWNLNDNAPDSYGGFSLPFADEIAKLTRSFDKVSGEAGDDLRDIFDITEGRGGPEQARSQNADFPSGARGFLSSALDIVQDQLNERQGQGGQGLEIGGLLGVISGTVKDASRNPEEKARLISPEIKDRVGEKLRSQHANIAEQFTRIALEHIKKWLRGNTSSRDLGDGAKAEIQDQVKDLVKGLGGLFGNKKEENSSARGFDESNRGDVEGGGGFSKVLSDKLSTGLARVHREVRLEFRKILGAIEKQLFELLPDQFQRPLEKILGGNPFDSQLDRDAGGQADRGFGDDLKAKLLNKIRDLIRKVQETLRGSILGVVNGGHRKFERESWMFVHTMVEQKVQRYLPDVKIKVPDDIGNENVSVGAPVEGSHMGTGSQIAAPNQTNFSPNQGRVEDSRHDQGGYSHGYQNERPPQQDFRPPQHDFQPPQHEYRPPQQEYRPPQQDFRPPQHDYRAAQPNYQDNQPGQYQPPQQAYQQQNYPSQGYSSQEYPQQHYSGGDHSQQSYRQTEHQYRQEDRPPQGYPPLDYQGGDYQQHNYEPRY